MINRNDIFVFCITIFIALIVVNPGLYLSDELAPANQLNQIYQGHQLTYHEGKYGLYENATMDKSIIGTHGVMIYPLLLPIISLPIYAIISFMPDASRLAPLIFWEFILLSLMNVAIIFYKNKLQGEKIFYGITILTLILNLIFYSTLITNLEVIAIVLTNVILYGLFGMYIWKFVCYLCDDIKYKRMFIWISVMCSSSLLFWVSTLKDHVLIALLFIMLLYYFIRFYETNDRNKLIVSAILSGLIIWERPELSIAIVPVIFISLVYRYKRFSVLPICTYGLVTFVSLIPMMVNNYMVTKSVFKFPYQAVNQTLGAYHLSSSSTISDIIITEIPTYIIRSFSTITLNNIIGVMLSPLNGGVGLLVFLNVVVIAFILMMYLGIIKKLSLIMQEKMLYVFSFVVILVYVFATAIGLTLHAETGILPDMRYFTLIYAPLMIASMSFLTRLFSFNYVVLVKKFVIWFGIILVFFTIGTMIISNGVMTMQSINLNANIMIILVSAISFAIIIDTIRTKRVDGLETMLCISISVPIVWQIFSSLFIIKLYSVQMILPLMDVIRKIIIG